MCKGNAPLETIYNVLGGTKEIKIRDGCKQKESSEAQVRRCGREGRSQGESVFSPHAVSFKICLILFLNNWYLEDVLPPHPTLSLWIS